MLVLIVLCNSYSFCYFRYVVCLWVWVYVFVFVGWWLCCLSLFTAVILGLFDLVVPIL